MAIHTVFKVFSAVYMVDRSLFFISGNVAYLFYNFSHLTSHFYLPYTFKQYIHQIVYDFLPCLSLWHAHNGLETLGIHVPYNSISTKITFRTYVTV